MQSYIAIIHCNNAIPKGIHSLQMPILTGFQRLARFLQRIRMKIGITPWNGRISPVFDVCEKCLLITFPGENREELVLRNLNARERARILKEAGVGTLICGAISNECKDALLGEGIELVPFIAGPIETIVSAWKRRGLEESRFSMPGCGCPRRHCRRRGRRGTE